MLILSYISSCLKKARNFFGKMRFHNFSCFVTMFLWAHIIYNVLRCWISKWFNRQKGAPLEEIIVVNQEGNNLHNSTFTESKPTIAANVLNEEILESDILQDINSTLPEANVIIEEIEPSDVLQDNSSTLPEANVVIEEIEPSDVLQDLNNTLPEENGIKEKFQKDDILQDSNSTLSEANVIREEIEQSDVLPDLNSTLPEANVSIEEIEPSDVLQDLNSTLPEENVIREKFQKDDILQDSNSILSEANVIKEEIQKGDILCDHTTIVPEQNVLNIKKNQKSDILLDSNSTILRQTLLNRESINKTTLGQQQVIEQCTLRCENTKPKQSVLETQQANILYNLLHFKLQDHTEKLYPSIIEPFPIQKVHSNHQLIRDLARAFSVNYPVDEFLKKPYTLTRLTATSDEYQKVHKLFSKGNNTYFNVEFIFKINNIFLHLHYLLLKAKYKWYYNNIELGESIMYHGTKKEFLPDICCWNFDKAKVKTHKFGKGISFANKPFYATFYHKENKHNFCKVMIMAHVLDGVGPSCIGYSSLVIPPAPSYTSTNMAMSVTVKYEDASFYPSYLISYKGLHPGYRDRVNYNFIQLF